MSPQQISIANLLKILGIVVGAGTVTGVGVKYALPDAYAKDHDQLVINTTRIELLEKQYTTINDKLDKIETEMRLRDERILEKLDKINK